MGGLKIEGPLYPNEAHLQSYKMWYSLWYVWKCPNWASQKKFYWHVAFFVALGIRAIYYVEQVCQVIKLAYCIQFTFNSI